MGLGEKSYSGEGKESVRTPLPFTLPLIQILTNPASPLVRLLPYILYFKRRMKKGRGEKKDKLPVKKEGRENEKEKKEKEKTTTKRNWEKNIKVFMPESLTTHHVSSVSLNMHTAQ